MSNGFIFDLNKCVGCHACVVACQIENGREQHVPWREINTFNGFQHPDLPVFHYSLACNHCDDAPCKSSCPALAYTRDGTLNTVVHHADRCIGCKYCTWACPYDAPKFSFASGVVEKCTACQDRLHAGSKPACANLCPTAALDYGPVYKTDQSRIPGFTDAAIGAGIDIVRLRTRKPPRTILHLDREEEKQLDELAQKAPSKITLQQEWVLVLFTLLIPAMTGFMASASLGRIELNPFVFILAGVTGLLLSSVHLGKKLRAWRAVLNLKKSWLSREIAGYGLFLASAIAWFLFPDYRIIGYVSVLMGFATAYSIDKVYVYLEKTTRLDLSSNSVFLTALLLTSLLTGNEQFALLILGLKLLLYLYRKIYFFIHRKKTRNRLALLRLTLGFIVPALLWFVWDAEPTWVVLLVFSAEAIDRIEFYLEGEVISPQRQLLHDFKDLRPLQSA